MSEEILMKITVAAYCVLIVALCAFSSQSLAQNRKAVSGAEVTGTFRNKAGSEFQIQALGNGKLKIHFEGIYPYKVNGEYTANTGVASGEANIAADKATFIPDYSKESNSSCTIALKFSKPGTVVVTQKETEGGCGFGHNVTADGTYRKISGKKPKFEQNQF
jgi:hypothetical protein